MPQIILSRNVRDKARFTSTELPGQNLSSIDSDARPQVDFNYYLGLTIGRKSGLRSAAVMISAVGSAFECCCQYYKAIAHACDSLIVEALRQQTELRRPLSAKNLKKKKIAPKCGPGYVPGSLLSKIMQFQPKTNFINKYH